MKTFSLCRFFLAVFGLIHSSIAPVQASPPPANGASFCQVVDDDQWAGGHPPPAAKRPADLNVGEPRTVRVIYFVPNDREPRQDIDSKLDTLLGDVRRFYVDEMERHGFGGKTFALETDDSGRALVHHVNGQFPASYYNGSRGVFGRVLREIADRYDTSRNIYFIAADITYPGSQWRGGGQAQLGRSTIAYIPYRRHGDEPFILRRYIAGHELGHSFGLQHDFRYRTYRREADIMSYTVGVDFRNRRLSKCAAEWLNAHPYFNTHKALPDNEPTTVRLLSPLANPPNAVNLRFEVFDADGLHQAQLMIQRENGFSLQGCKSLNGSDSETTEFITTELTAGDSNRVSLGTIDVRGNYKWKEYSIWLDDSLERVDETREAGGSTPERLLYVSGNDQIGYPHTRLEKPFIVTVRGSGNEPVAETRVTFRAIAGDGNLSVANPWTDSDGHAGSFLALGNFRGQYRVVASVAGIDDKVTFGATVNTSVVTGAPAETLRGHTNEVLSVAFSPDGDAIATGSWDRTLRLWDASTGESRATFSDFTQGVTAVAYAPDGRTLATNGNLGEIRLRDAVSGTHKQTIEGVTEQRRQTTHGHTSPVTAIAYSPDGRTLATGDQLGEIRLWDADSGQYRATLSGHTFSVSSLAFNADSRRLASSSIIFEGSVRLWDPTSGQQLMVLDRELVRPTWRGFGISYSPDGRTLAITGASDLKIRLWDTMTWQPSAILSGHRTPTYPVAFSPDGATLVTGSAYGEIWLWDVGTGQQVMVLIGHSEEIRSLAISPDGRTLASGSADHTVKLWDISPEATPQLPMADFDGDGTVGFSDFVQFAARFGLSRGDAGYDARFDLDGDGTVGFSDFVIFAGSFGQSA